MTLTVDTRSEESRHIGLWWYGNCQKQRNVCTSFNLHRHSTGWPPCKSMMQSYHSIDLLEDTVAISAAVANY